MPIATFVVPVVVVGLLLLGLLAFLIAFHRRRQRTAESVLKEYNSQSEDESLSENEQRSPDNYVNFSEAVANRDENYVQFSLAAAKQ